MPRTGTSAATMASSAIVDMRRRSGISPRASRSARSRSASSLLPDTPQARSVASSQRASVSQWKRSLAIAVSTRPTIVAAALPLSCW